MQVSIRTNMQLFGEIFKAVSVGRKIFTSYPEEVHDNDHRLTSQTEGMLNLLKVTTV